MLNAIKYSLVKIVESHPYTWFFAWTLIHKLTFLLPHDKSYFAIKHFCNHTNNELFLDVGANTGISALSFRKLNKNIPIFSIEPNNIHHDTLNKLKEKLAPFDFLLIGVGDREMHAEFFTPIYKGIILHTFTSVSEEQVRQGIHQSFGPKIAKKMIVNKSSAPILCLDKLDLKPSIIKIDAEGFDYNVLLGARQTIELYQPFIMFEACHTNIALFKLFFQEIDFAILTYHCDTDVFSEFHPELLSSVGGGRNIFAVPYEKVKLLPFAK